MGKSHYPLLLPTLIVSATAFISMAPIYHTPWVPALRGNVLTPFVMVEELEESGVRPTPLRAEEREWTPTAVKEVVNGIPMMKEALLESLLAVWRLQMCQEESDKPGIAEAWQDHLEAWLVRDSLSSGVSARGF